MSNEVLIVARWPDRVRVIAGVYAFAGGASSFLGWLAGIYRLTDWEGNGITIKANAALAAAAAGAALVLMSLRRGRAWVGVGLGAFVALVGGLTLIQHATGLNFGIDTLLFDEPAGALATAAPGRMGPPASSAFLLVGSALVLLAGTSLPAARTAIAAFGVAVVAVSSLSIIGYLYGAERLYALPRFTGIAFQTATMLLLLGVGLIASVPERGPLRLLCDDGAAGMLLRRALPALLALPLVLGWLRVRGEQAGLYEARFGTALRTLVELALLLVLLWWSAGLLRWHERRQRRSAQRVSEAEAELREQGKELAEAQRLTHIGSWQWDARTDVTTGSDELFRIYGLDPAKRSFPDFKDQDGTLYPHESWRQINDAVRRTLETGVGYELDVPALRGGVPFWITARSEVVRDDRGEVIGLRGTVQDITQRKLAEESVRRSRESLSDLVEHAPFGVYIVDSSFRIAQMNAGSRAGAFGNVRPVIGRDLGEAMRILWPEPVAADIVARFRRTLETGEPYCSRDFINPRGDIDAVESYEWELHRITLPDGEQGVVCYYFDSTRLRKAEQAMRQSADAERAARAEAERAARAKDEFLAVLSHELRTPLNAILGWSQLLRRGKVGPEDVRHGMATIERNARTQTQLIEDLLDVSRITTGRLRLEVRRVDPTMVIEAALEAVLPAAGAKEIDVLKALDPDPGPVNGDPARLQQVVWNLLTNAVKFTPRGGKVQVRLRRVDSHVEITVSDNGEGIRPEFLPHVFERFRQADQSTTRRHGGMGLGLNIVKQLTEMHGGTVRVHSPGEGQGTTFVVSLPASVNHAPSDGDARRLPCASGEASPPELPAAELGGLRVLVVDDEPDAVDLIQRLLRDCGAEVRTAASVAEALDTLDGDLPDVLISDIGMPGQDGYDLIRRLRARGHGVRRMPAVALTAFARSEDRQRALLAGYQMHLTKPVEPGELAAAVASLCGRTLERNGDAPAQRAPDGT